MKEKGIAFIVGFFVGRVGWPVMVHAGYLGVIALLLVKILAGR